MKYFKYLVLAMIVSFVASSCSQNDPRFPWREADASKAYVQVYYMSLVANNSANAIKYVTINGTEYSYNHNALISPYNFSPSMVVGSSYETEPGLCTVKLETETSAVAKDADGNKLKDWTGEADSIVYTRTAVYEGTTEVECKAGEVSQVIVWDNCEYDAEGNMTKQGAAPHVHAFGTPTIYNEVDSTGHARFASARLYNYMFDAAGKPTEARMFFDVRRKNNGDIVATYPADSIGLAFGESTDYFTTELYQDQILGSTGYIYVRQDIRLEWPVGCTLYPEGKTEIILKNDYWSTYLGSSYHYFYYGSYDTKVQKRALKRFTAK